MRPTNTRPSYKLEEAFNPLELLKPSRHPTRRIEDTGSERPKEIWSRRKET